MVQILYSVLLNTKKVEKNGIAYWEKERNFYYGDLSKRDINWHTDWRFKEVPDKRKQVIFLGTVTTKFPIEFPLVLDNGCVLNRNDYERD